MSDDRPFFQVERFKVGCCVQRVYFCDRCRRPCRLRFDHPSGLVCRWCAGVARKRLRPLDRVDLLRRKIKAPPFPAPLPPPPPWSRRRWYLIAAEINMLERQALDRLDAEMREIEGLAGRFGLTVEPPR